MIDDFNVYVKDNHECHDDGLFYIQEWYLNVYELVSSRIYFSYFDILLFW